MVCQLLFIGTTELLLIGGMALLLFGGKKLPEMMRGLGQGVKEFKNGMNEIKGNAEDGNPIDSSDLTEMEHSNSTEESPSDFLKGEGKDNDGE